MFINKEFSTILELLEAFPDEQSCIDHLEVIRWDGNVVSPFQEDSKVYNCKGNRYKCKDTGKYFNVKTGTLFEDSKIPLRKWFIAIYLLCTHKKGLSSYQLAEDLGVTQKTAWFMSQRIRSGLGLANDSIEPMSGDIEVDETYVGGKNKNRHKDKKVKNSQGRAYIDKTPVFGMVERGGSLKAVVVPDVKGDTLKPIIYENVYADSTIHSDEWHAYRGLNKYYTHKVVDHGKRQYVDGDAHTNTIEGAWSHLKRAIIGVFHNTSRKHLQKYVDGFVFRYNSRDMSNTEKFNLLLMFCGIRVTYKNLIGEVS